MWLPGDKNLDDWTVSFFHQLFFMFVKLYFFFDQVQDVHDFIYNQDGCSELAEQFRSQEIDGLALQLIKEDHIIESFNLKLGPALKICRKIKNLKARFGC